MTSKGDTEARRDACSDEEAAEEEAEAEEEEAEEEEFSPASERCAGIDEGRPAERWAPTATPRGERRGARGWEPKAGTDV